MGSIEMRRHGDVLILTQDGFSIPKSVELKAGKLIHQGTNNAHVISKGEVKFGEYQGKKVMRVLKPSIVSHVGGSSTHKDGELPEGDYWYEIQTFYDHITEESKRVID
jgi:hypothetical protein